MSEAYRLQLAERLAAPPLNDIPAKLRQLADRLDRGDIATDGMLLVFDDDNKDELSVIGFGTYTPAEAHYALCLAQQLLLGH